MILIVIIYMSYIDDCLVFVVFNSQKIFCYNLCILYRKLENKYSMKHNILYIIFDVLNEIIYHHLDAVLF